MLAGSTGLAPAGVPALARSAGGTRAVGPSGSRFPALSWDVSHRSALERTPEQGSEQSERRETSRSESSGHTMAVGSVESGKLRSAVIWQAWYGLRGGLKHDDSEDEHAEALRPAHQDSVHSQTPSARSKISFDVVGDHGKSREFRRGRRASRRICPMGRAGNECANAASSSLRAPLPQSSYTRWRRLCETGRRPFGSGTRGLLRPGLRKA